MTANAPNTHQRFTDGAHLSRRVVRVDGQFFPNGTGTIDNTKNVGDGFTVTRAGVGIIDVKFRFPSKKLLSFLPRVQTVSAATPARVVPVLQTHNTDGTWTVRLHTTDLANTSSADIDLAADAATCIHFSAAFQNVGQ